MVVELLEHNPIFSEGYRSVIHIHTVRARHSRAPCPARQGGGAVSVGSSGACWGHPTSRSLQNTSSACPPCLATAVRRRWWSAR